MGKYTRGRAEVADAEKKFNGWECFVHSPDAPVGQKLVAIAIGIDKKNATANAALIAEAFNVAAETGRTPRQLADERGKLLAACKAAVANYDEIQSVLPENMRGGWEEDSPTAMMRAAIAEAEAATP